MVIKAMDSPTDIETKMDLIASINNDFIGFSYFSQNHIDWLMALDKNLQYYFCSFPCVIAWL